MPEVSRATERRRGRRAAVALNVEERTNDALYFQRATSLSSSGVWLEGTLPHPPGTRVELDLELPGGKARVVGEVVGRDPEAPGMAVRFIELTEDFRARLEALVTARAPALTF